jgi:hypothetical protein
MSVQLKRLFFLLTISYPVLSVTAQQPPANEKLVVIAPCRLVDTRVNTASAPTEENARRIDIAASRCGRFVPTSATAYSLRITSYDRTNEGTIPPQAVAAPPPLSRHPYGAPITFPVPPGTHIAVDLEGYYVPPNTPTDPIAQGTSSPSASIMSTGAHASTSGAASHQPSVQSLHDGTAGELYLDASRYGVTGVFGVSSATHPWVMMMSGDTDGSAGFGVYNGNFSELLRVSSSGPTRMIQGWSYLSGRTDYRETASIPGNIVNEVKIVNPRDASGTATNRVTFYDATSDDEVGSPPTTKYRAFTLGYYSHPDINFDSQIGYSWPGSQEYYYRAFCARDGQNGRETYWVKAATNFDAITNTRADMYVSGIVGIGKTPDPNYALDVNGIIHATQVIGATYQDVAEWVPATSTMEPGTVVVLNRQKTNEVMPSSEPYDTAVAGVVSGQPGVLLGEAGVHKAKIATTGRVRVRVDATSAPIAIGDLLVTSASSGTAMRSEPIEIHGRRFHQPGTVIGKALEPLATGQGEVLVLLSLQ